MNTVGCHGESLGTTEAYWVDVHSAETEGCRKKWGTRSGETESESAVQDRVWTVEVWWCQGEISETELIIHGVETK